MTKTTHNIKQSNHTPTNKIHNYNCQNCQNCFENLINSIIWSIGFCEGLFLGICVGCCESISGYEMVDKMMDGCDTGYTDGEMLSSNV